jgi:hypothetical protein
MYDVARLIRDCLHDLFRVRLLRQPDSGICIDEISDRSALAA